MIKKYLLLIITGFSTIVFSKTDVTFLAVADLHYGKPPHDKNELQIKAMNLLKDGNFKWPKTLIKEEEEIKNIRGLLIAGDITETGDPGILHTKDQLNTFLDDYGLLGEKKLKLFVYEGYGNHDYYVWHPILSPFLKNHPVLNIIAQRNKRRLGVKHYAQDDEGHYSWDWDDIHFVNINLSPSNKIAYGWCDPKKAYEFLKKDLAKFSNNIPTVIMFHYVLSKNKKGEDESKWIKRNEQERFCNLVKNYNIIAIIHGHFHNTRTYKWCGISVYNVGSPFYNIYSNNKGHFTIFRITNDYMVVADVSWSTKIKHQIKDVINIGDLWQDKKKLNLSRFYNSNFL